MGFYDKHILPRFINCACGASPIMKQREKVVPGRRELYWKLALAPGLTCPITMLIILTESLGWIHLKSPGTLLRIESPLQILMLSL